jgi:transcription termination/antitermination protein NusG
MILTIRTTSGRENAVIDSLASRIKSRKLEIKALIQTEDLRGYVFIEADDIDLIRDAVKGVPHIRGVIEKDVTVAELDRFLVPEKQIIRSDIGDIVEIISGPFKGERAKVTRYDEMKGEVIVELLEAAIPIPVTIPVATTRTLERAKKE